jgi:tRNA(Ile)-lysidine synthase TilS/MesJ
MELIRPMYQIRESEIVHWRDDNHLQFIRCACHFTEQCANSGNRTATGDTLSKRAETKELIRKLAQTNPGIENNIFRSMENIHLNAVLGWKFDGEKKYFLDHYQK